MQVYHIDLSKGKSESLLGVRALICVYMKREVARARGTT